MGSFSKKMKSAWFKEQYSTQLLFFNAFQNTCRFRDIMGQRFAVLAPKILNFATKDLKNDMMRLRSTSGTIPLL